MWYKCLIIFTTNRLDFLSPFKIVLLAVVFKSMFIFHSIMFYVRYLRDILLRIDQIIDRGNNSNNQQVQLINPRLMCLMVCDKYLTDTVVLRCLSMCKTR